ncbi:MAG: hypothetical protein ABI670_08905 [Chloroflexota bacterium]
MIPDGIKANLSDSETRFLEEAIRQTYTAPDGDLVRDRVLREANIPATTREGEQLLIKLETSGLIRRTGRKVQGEPVFKVSIHLL